MRRTPRSDPGRPVRGLTLLEIVIALAIIAVLASLALPSMGSGAARQRLKAAAEGLAHDLAEARYESARRGAPVHLSVRTGADWCWATVSASGCDCHASLPCRLRPARAADHPGVRLVAAEPVSFLPSGDHSLAATSSTLVARLESARGERLQVDLTRLGRARICAPGGAVPGYPAC
jgi:type IV fimbrial biogenesis protein FimT